jgi:hypothetical protein
MYTIRRLERSVAVVLLSWQLSACTGWRVASPSPADFVEREHPDEIRVQRRDGGSEVLYAPEVRRDSLVGRGTPDATQSDRALALSDVERVATRHVSGARTAGLLLGIGAVVGVIVAASNFQGPLDNWGQ